MLWSDPFVPFVSQLTRTAAFMPSTDVSVSDGDLVVTMDVPGLTAADVSIDFQDDYLVVRGERRRPELADGASWVHAERAFGAFERVIKVPAGVDPDNVTASLENGVLSLIVPKPERLKRRSIAIEAGKEERQLETANA